MRKTELPLDIQIEPSVNCNLDCIMCNKEARGRTKDMSLSFFKKIINQFPKLRRITLHGIGEPLINKDFIKMASYSKQKGAKVFFNTNMTLMTPEKSSQLTQIGVDEIRVSLDAPTKELYQKIRQKDMLNTVIKNATSLCNYSKYYGNTKVKMVAVIMDENINYLPQLTTLAVDIGVDELMIQNMQFWSGNEEYLKRRKNNAVDTEKIDRIRNECKKIAGNNINLKMLHSGVQTTCTWPWTSCYITAEGYVTPCCNSPDPRILNFGNLKDKTIQEIWDSPEYNQFRVQLQTRDKNQIPKICNGCIIYDGKFKEY